MKGIKYDTGKALPDLVLGDFMAALEHPVFAGTFGAHKYEPKNFQQLENGERRYAEGAFRHYMARKKGEMFDPESGELHHAHELWCRIAELYFWLKENDHLEWEKAITRRDGLYHHPTLDDFGCEWQAEPFWYDTEDARKIVWHLASEQKGELDIRVEVRPKVYEAHAFDIEMDPLLFAEVILNGGVRDGAFIYDTVQNLWLTGISSGLSEWHPDPEKAVRLHMDCARKFRDEQIGDKDLSIQLDIWFVLSESGDFYQGGGEWTDQAIDANAWTKKEANDHIVYLKKFSNTNPRLAAA